jgi:hypothetical protein
MSDEAKTHSAVSFDGSTRIAALSVRVTLVVLVHELDEWAAHAIAMRGAMATDQVVAVSLAGDDTDRRRLLDDWAATCGDIPLTVLDSDIKSLSRRFARYLEAMAPGPDHQIVVLIPRPKAKYLGSARKHVQTAEHLRTAVSRVPWTVTLEGSVPWSGQSRP